MPRDPGLVILEPCAPCPLVLFASLLFSSLSASADNDSMVRHTAFTCSTRQRSILSRCRKCDLFDTFDVQCRPPPPLPPTRRFTNHGVGLFTTPAPRPPAQHLTLRIRPHARVILPRDRPTELVNRPSLASPVPTARHRQLSSMCVDADAGPVLGDH